MNKSHLAWDCVPLSRLAKVQTGIAKNQSLAGDTVERPYLRVANVQDGYLDLSEVKVIGVPQSKVERYSLRYGDVLFTEGGDFDKLGRGCVWRGEVEGCLHQNHVFAVRTDARQLLPDFLALIAESNHGKRYFLKCSKKSTNLASINSTQLKALPVPRTPFTVQRAVVGISQAFERASVELSKELGICEKRKAGLMQELLSGRRRFPEFSGLERESWRLSDLAKRISRKNTSGVGPVLTASGERGLVDQKTFFDSKVSGENLAEYYRIFRGEFAYNRSRMNGYPFGAVKSLRSCDSGAVSTLYICFSINADICDPMFFEQFSEAGMLDSELRKRTQVGGRAHGLLNITLDDFFGIPIQLPGIDEQRRIAELLGMIDKEIDLLRESKKLLEKRKRGVMERLLSGEITIPDDVVERLNSEALEAEQLRAADSQQTAATCESAS